MENFEYQPNNGTNATPTDKSPAQISNETPASNVGVSPIKIPKLSTVPTTLSGNVSTIGADINTTQDLESNPYLAQDYISDPTQNQGIYSGGEGSGEMPNFESNAMQMAGAYQGGYFSGANSETVVDVSKYKKYIRGTQVSPGSIEDLNRLRAIDQSAFAQAGNAALRVVANVLPEIGQQIGGLFTNWTEADKEHANIVVETMAGIKQDVNDALPIYRVNPGKTFDMTDPAWWFDNGSNVVTSGLAFAAIGYATGGIVNAGLTAGARGVVGGVNSARALATAEGITQAATLSPQLANAITGATTLTNSILLNQMETTGIMGQTWKEAYDKELVRLQRLPENLMVEDVILENRAKRVASEASVTAGQINRINILTNLTSLSRLGNPYLNTTRRLLTEPTIKKSLVRYGYEMGQEALEETINSLAQDIAVNKLNTSRQILKSATSAESLEQAFFGALGGGFQTGVTSVINRMPTSTNKQYTDAYNDKIVTLNKSNPNLTKEELDFEATKHAISVAGKKKISKNSAERLAYENQQRAINEIKDKLSPDQVSKLSTLFLTEQERTDLYNEIDRLEKAGDVNRATLLKEKNILSTIIQSFENGTTTNLEEQLQAILNISQEDAVKYNLASSLEDVSYKDSITQSLNDIKVLEKAYNRSYGLLDMDEIFNTEVRINELNKLVNKRDSQLINTFSPTFANFNESSLLTSYLNSRITPSIEDFTEEYGENVLQEDLENIRGSFNVNRANTQPIIEEIQNLKEYLTILKSKDYQRNLRKHINDAQESKDITEGIDDTINNVNLEPIPVDTDVSEEGTAVEETEDKAPTPSNVDTPSTTVAPGTRAEDIPLGITNPEVVNFTSEEDITFKNQTLEDYGSFISTIYDDLKNSGVEEDVIESIRNNISTKNPVDARNIFDRLAELESDPTVKTIYQTASTKSKTTINLLRKRGILTDEEIAVEAIENNTAENILNRTVENLPSNGIRFHSTGYTDADGVFQDLNPLLIILPNTVLDQLINTIKANPNQDVLSDKLLQIKNALFSQDVTELIDNGTDDSVDGYIDAQKAIVKLIQDYQTYLKDGQTELYNKQKAKERQKQLEEQAINEARNQKEADLIALAEKQKQEEQFELERLQTQTNDTINEIEQAELSEEEKEIAVQEAQEEHQKGIDEIANNQKQQELEVSQSYDVEFQSIHENNDTESDNFVPFANIYESLDANTKQVVDEARVAIDSIFNKLEERGVDVTDYHAVIGALEAMTSEVAVAKNIDLLTFFLNEKNDTNITRPVLKGLDVNYFRFLATITSNIDAITDYNEVWTHDSNSQVDSIIGNIATPTLLLEDQVDYSGGKKSTIASKVAYLAKDYVSFVKDGKYYRQDLDGEVRIEENDVRLLSNKQGITEGTTVTLRPLTEEEYIQEFNGEYDGSYSDSIDSIPIGLFVDGTRLKGAYLHAVSWVNNKNLQTNEEGLLNEINTLKELRRKIVDSNSIDVKISNVTRGSINTDVIYSPLADVAPDLSVVAVRNGKAYEEVGVLSEVTVPNGVLNGTTAIIVPTSTGDVLLPLTKNSLTSELNQSIYKIVESFIVQDSREDSDKALKQELEIRGLDYSSFASLRNFLNPIINVNTARHLNSEQYAKKYTTNKDKISTIKISNNSVEFTYDGASYFLSREMFNRDPLVTQNILQNQFRELLTTMTSNIDINSLNKTIQFPLISNENEIVGEINDYNDFIKTVVSTNLNPITLDSGEVIYEIQKSYTLDYDSAIVPLSLDTKEDIIEPTTTEALGTDVYGNVQDNSRGLDEDSFDDLDFDLSPEVENLNSPIQTIFNESNLDSIGTIEDYTEYLSTIFPNSTVKDIVYNGNKLGTPRFSKFDYFDAREQVAFFSDNIEHAKVFGTSQFAILDMQNPFSSFLSNGEYNMMNDSASEFSEEIADNQDSIYAENVPDAGFNIKEYIVFDPKQVHILGSEQDLAMFKEYLQGREVTYDKDILEDTELVNSLESALTFIPDNTNINSVIKYLETNNIVKRICD